MRSVSVVTTFSPSGYIQYGKKMLQSFIQYWDEDITLYVYYEGEMPTERAKNIVYVDANVELRDLHTFKRRHEDNPLAHGKHLIKTTTKGKQIGIGFKWDAVRFAHKVYAIAHAAERCNTDLLFWMDADTVTFAKIPYEFVESLFLASELTCYLGRKNKYSECGFVGYNMKHKFGKAFVRRFKQMYDTDEIFSLDEWHDSYVYDRVREEFEYRGAENANLSYDMNIKEGHPLINSCLGRFLDHLKGDRKIAGKSNKSDLIVKRSEDYWNK